MDKVEIICYFCGKKLKYEYDKNNRLLKIMPCRACVGVGFTVFYKNTKKQTKEEYEQEIERRINNIINKIMQTKVE